MAILRIYLSPDEGFLGMRFKRGYNEVKWQQLSDKEQHRIISYLEKILTICKSNKL